MQRETAKLAQAIDKSMASGVNENLAKAFGDVDTDRLSKGASGTGDKWASLFERQVSKRLKGMADDLPTFSPKADLDEFDKALKETKKELGDLAKTKLSPGDGGNLDVLGGKLDDITARMTKLSDSAQDANKKVQLQDVAKQAQMVSDSLKTAWQQNAAGDGRTYGGKFSDEAKKAITKSLSELPEVQVGASITEAEKGIAEIRDRLEALRDKKIGVDVNRERFEQELSQITKDLDTVSKKPHPLGFEYDSKAAADSLRDFSEKVGPVLDRQLAELGRNGGETWAGAYADSVQQRLKSAALAIPNTGVQIDTSEAQVKLAAIRHQLALLANKKVGVDIDAGAAEAEITALRKQLDALNGKNVSIDIKTNAAKAAAELAAISAETDKSSGAMEAFSSEAGITMSRLGYLIAIGSSLGSLIAPAAAAAALGVAGIGVAASAALSGVGVFTLGLYGIGDAVKKIVAYQADADTSAKSFSASQVAVANATDGVRDAEQNLTYARQDASSAAVESQRRIADAEKNVGKAQKDAADSVARAREQEKEAVSDLARTRRDAADSIAEAVSSEKDAEVASNKAIKDQIQARADLATAIKAATADLKELQTEVKRNQLDIDEATTAAMQAKQDLDKIMSNPRATEIERRQALEAYQDKVIQIEELKAKQGDLAKQQAAADKDGVESTDRVKKARQAVADADDRAASAAESVAKAQKAVDKAHIDATLKIGDAEKRVADARAATSKAQQDGAEKVATAQEAVATAQRDAAKQQQQSQRQILNATEAVTKAQRALQQASVNAGVAGGDAYDSMKDALNALSPAGQAFAKWLVGLKPKLDELRKSAQEGLLPGLQAGLEVLISNYFPAFDRYVSRLAIGLGNMVRATATILLTPQWRAFFSYLDQSALPALQGMWVMAVNLATGVANLIRALAPLSKPMGKGLVDLTTKFAHWSETLSTNNGFKAFSDYAVRVGPKVVNLFEQLVTLVGHLVIAAAPMGELILNIVSGIVGFINSWDLGVLSGVIDVIAILGTGIVILTGLMRGIKFVTEAWKTIMVITKTVTDLMTAATARYAAATAGATDATGLLNGTMFKAKAAGESGAVGMLAMDAAAGPLGLALLAISIAWFAIEGSQKKASKSTEELGQALEDMGKAYQQAAASATLGSSKVEDSFRQIVSQNKDMQQAVLTLNSLGLGLDDIAGAAGGSAAELDRVLGAINAKLKALNAQKQSAEAQNEASRQSINNIKIYDDQINTLTGVRDKFQEAASAAHVTSDAMAVLNAQTTDANTAAALLTPSEQALADAQATLADSSSTAQEKLDALTKAQDTMRQSTTDAIEADEAFHQAKIGLTQAVNQAKDAHDKNATSLSLNTTQGLRNRDMIEELINSSNKMYDSDVALNGVTVDAVKKGNDHIKQIKEVAKQLGLNKSQTDKLIKSYNTIPPSVTTAIGFKAGDFDKMFQQLEQAAFIQKALKTGEDIDKARQDYKNMISDRNRAKNHGWATGGPIAGPGISGGPTEDSNLIWASRGEYMQPAASVNYYGGGLMEALRRRAIPREAFPGYAKGGSILGSPAKWPYNMKLDAWVPTDAQLIANTPGLGEGAWSGQLSANKTVSKMQQFALNQAGKRYLWAAVGPQNYDCSGLVGNLWAIATGHSLYHRYMSTGDMGAGKHGMVSGPGKYFTVYLGPGHTAALVGGLHAEAYGGNGTPLAIGHIGERLSYYTSKLHLPGFAEGGAVDDADLGSRKGRIVSFLKYGWPEPPKGNVSLTDLLKAGPGGTYDSGGMLPPGYSTVYNGTGSPEAVLTGQQWQTIAQMVDGGGGAAGSTYNFQFRDTTLDPGYLRKLQQREAVLARYGRAR
jgi:hypothetical protein